MQVKTKPAFEIVPGARHPMEKYLRTDRIPHIWCSGCGLGTVLGNFLYALDELGWDPDEVAVVSGIGCTGRIAGYLKLDAYHTTHGRAIPFATGLKLANPKLHVAVISGDGDLFAIGGNHLIHAARRNLDLTVVCVNNFNYGMTGGQCGPTTPLDGKTTTTPFGNFEHPFNLVHLAASAGASYVARWTTLDGRRLQKGLVEAMAHEGFTFVEVISPCPTNYGRRNRIGEGLDELRYYADHAVIRHGADPKEAEIVSGKPFLVGKFVDVDKPTYHEMYAAKVAEMGGNK
ncbi:MAG: 2-oxoacid:ferredoxin oxidoreductase subunit beta [Candidatus Bipolaricaulis sp.]|jgi:2-oxoglutarate ferredoxin oxidoreductase subunit beta|uniref:2-oxoglutarate synthase subunit KorB n=1 Tax=Candidatus Bipolaricaulis anaerobius TaxID=2026885 RepID=A0A2X3KJ22_9BACT|nr:2-oxoacid:ferredoxin oxidoreductase subunit beta [Candidatus Bipolaricaulis anaerobius]MBP7726186.1 2-oxoacid:ferredoxin oxidoreductase subunit beta [Candidatus Bipolaricaulis sp.]SQD92352.1 2-oxoglutarate synthase subunit KorB [Candidatus Bipolaricaulis anaerobius]HQM38413.1 2-oxoacid:ferredoxin oxidoreductase subunit beta [Candidatus Bipolaricaulis anaerobius]